MTFCADAVPVCSVGVWCNVSINVFKKMQMDRFGGLTCDVKGWSCGWWESLFVFLSSQQTKLSRKRCLGRFYCLIIELKIWFSADWQVINLFQVSCAQKNKNLKVKYLCLSSSPDWHLKFLVSVTPFRVVFLCRGNTTSTTWLLSLKKSHGCPFVLS